MAVYPTGAIHRPVDNFCWDTGTMSWIMQTCGSGGGGGGATTITDGVDPTIVATVLDLTDSNPLTVAIVDAAGDQITSFGSGAIRRVATATVNGFIASTDIDCTDCESVVINLNSAALIATLQAKVSIDGSVFYGRDLLEITSNLTMARLLNLQLTGGTDNRSWLLVLPPGAVTARVEVTAYTSGTSNMTMLATSEFHQTVAALVRRNATDTATGLPVLGFSAAGIVTTPSVEAASTYDRFTPGFVTHIGSGNNAAAPVTVRLGDGTNSADVKAASTAAVATDKAQVVAISPNNGVKITDGTDTALVTAAGEQNVLATAQPGVDIGDVTVNNAAGAAAVNIQDGGNSITVDGTVTAVVADTVGTPAALNALNAFASVAMAGCSSASFALSGAGTLVGTLVAIASYDGGANFGLTYFMGTGGTGNGQISSSIVLTNPNPIAAASILVPGGATHVGVFVSAYTSGSVTATVRATAASSDVRVTQGANATTSVNAWNMKLVDNAGNDVVAVKGASTPAVATDPSLVVAISPNNTVPVSVGALSVAQGAAAAGVTGPMVQALVNDAPQLYASSTVRPLSLTTDGQLKVASSDWVQRRLSESLLLEQQMASIRALLIDERYSSQQIGMELR